MQTSAKPWELETSATPPSGMDSNTVIIASVTVVCVIVAVVIIVLLVLCLYRRRKRASHRNKTHAKRPKSGHGSSTIRSDKSDHPYENPSLTRNLRADHAAKMAKQSSKPGAVRHSDPYSNLKGHSLPHHYQGLNQELQSLEDSAAYDELMPPSTSSEGNNSDYYFKLEAGSRSNSGIRPGVQPAARPGVDPTDPEEAYDMVVVANTTSNNSNQNKERSNRSNAGKGDGANPYYFKVENLQGGSSTAPASVRNHGKLSLSAEQGKSPRDETDAKSSKPNVTKDFTVRERVNSYDKLDRSTLPAPKTEDINANEYDKLVPQLAVKPHNGNSITKTNDGYLKVNMGEGVGDTDVDSLTEFNDYNKLERGVEKEFDNLMVSEKESSTL